MLKRDGSTNIKFETHSEKLLGSMRWFYIVIFVVDPIQ